MVRLLNMSSGLLLCLVIAVPVAAQATKMKEKMVTGASTVKAMQLKGEVVAVKGNEMVARMVPSGEYQLFTFKPDQTATVDGVVMPLAQVKPGTMLTASVAMMETPVTERTVTTLEGTVWHSSPTSVILTLANGQNQQFDVPPGLKFDVDGQMKEAMELKPGMKIKATKVTAAPRREVSTDAVVTGTMKK